MAHNYPGILINFEGIDGSGKSLLLANVAATLEAEQTALLVTKEPGGTWLGLHLRSILQQRTAPLNGVAEFLLFAADRAQHFDQLIIPALKEGKVVLSDRMSDSSLAYQGFGRGIDKQMISTVNNWAMQGVKPDLTVYLKISWAQARTRIGLRQEKLTSFEREPERFWNEVIGGFESIFAERTNVVTLDATLKPDELSQATLAEIKKLLEQRR